MESVTLYLPWYLRVQGKALMSVIPEYLGVPSNYVAREQYNSYLQLVTFCDRKGNEIKLQPG